MLSKGLFVLNVEIFTGPTSWHPKLFVIFAAGSQAAPGNVKNVYLMRYNLWWMLNTMQLQMSEQRGPSLLCQDYQEWKLHWAYHMSEERVWIFNISFWWRCGHCGLEIYICIEFISSLNSRRGGWREQVAGEGPRVGAGPGGCGWWQHKYWVVRPIGSRVELMINFCVKTSFFVIQ